MPTSLHLESLATLADLRTTRTTHWATRPAKTPSSTRLTAALLVSTVVALATAGGVWAATIYSDFGTTPPTFNQGLGYGVAGALAGGPGMFGAEFTVPGTGSASVTGVDVALEHILINGSNGAVVASFWTASAGIPGSQIGGSFAVTAPAGFPPTVVSISNITGVTLGAGQSYFLVLRPSDAFSQADWSANNQGVTGGVADIGAGWQSIGANAVTPVFDVIATLAPLPEPASWMLLVAGLAGLGLNRRGLV